MKLKDDQYKSLIEMTRKLDLDELDENTLIISDVDGVFFKGIFDPREIIGLIDDEVLKAFEKLLGTKASFWVFTNRMKLFKTFPYIKQIKRSIKKMTQQKAPLYTSCLKFLENKPQNYIIIMNAKKPGKSSQEVLLRGLELYDKVIYIGSQDLPFYHNDVKLVERIRRKSGTDKLTYIEISSWKKKKKTKKDEQKKQK